MRGGDAVLGLSYVCARVKCALGVSNRLSPPAITTHPLPCAQGRYLNGKHMSETSAPQAYGVHDVQGLLKLLHWDRDEVDAVDTTRMMAASADVDGVESLDAMMGKL